MDYITTTDLRTKTPKLVNSLKAGQSIKLIHRSKVIGQIKPALEGKPFDAVKFKELIKDIHLPHTTPEERENIYRERLEEKYGKPVS